MTGSHKRVVGIQLVETTSRSASPFYTLRPGQNGRHFADVIFKCFFLSANAWISIKISLNFVRKGLINNITALPQKMAWRRPAIIWTIDGYRNWPRYGLHWSGLCCHFRHSTSGTGRRAAACGRLHECRAGSGSTNHDSADRMSDQFLFYHENEAIHTDKSRDDHDDKPPCWNARLTKAYVVTIQIYRNSHAKVENSKMHILRCMGSLFCVKFQRAYLKFHTKCLTHTPQNMHFTMC